MAVRRCSGPRGSGRRCPSRRAAGIIASRASDGPSTICPFAAAALPSASGVTAQPAGFGRDRFQPASRKKSSMPEGVAMASMSTLSEMKRYACGIPRGRNATPPAASSNRWSPIQTRPLPLSMTKISSSAGCTCTGDAVGVGTVDRNTLRAPPVLCACPGPAVGGSTTLAVVGAHVLAGAGTGGRRPRAYLFRLRARDGGARGRQPRGRAERGEDPDPHIPPRSVGTGAGRPPDLRPARGPQPRLRSPHHQERTPLQLREQGRGGLAAAPEGGPWRASKARSE